VRGNIRRSQDLYTGLTFIAFGLAAVFFARPLRFGTAAQMGPGYFPSVLGGILALLGLVILIRSVWSTGTRVSPLALRPLLFVTAAVVAFGVLLRPMGLVVATLALVVVARLADREFRVTESALLALFLAVVATGLFVYGLRLPFNVWPG
jgi:NADH:ubiquinone oxidoreductase subunit 2 (subunit N)